MSRFVTILAAAALLLGGAACRKDPDLTPMHPKPGDLPPLPPASGTSVGYLIDAASTIEMRPEQLDRMKQIDQSLAAQNDVLDTQIRQIEKPMEDEPVEKGAPPARKNMAPGASNIVTQDSQKLHAQKKTNDRDALKKAFELLDPPQQERAKKILQDRGVEVPGMPKAVKQPDPDDGEPLPEGLPPGEP